MDISGFSMPSERNYEEKRAHAMASKRKNVLKDDYHKNQRHTDRRDEDASSSRRHEKRSRSRDEKKYRVEHRRRSGSKRRRSISWEENSSLRDRSLSRKSRNSRSDEKLKLKSREKKDSNSKKEKKSRSRERYHRSRDRRSRDKESFSNIKTPREKKSVKHSSRLRETSRERQSESTRREKERREYRSRSREKSGSRRREHKRRSSRSKHRRNKSRDRSDSYKRNNFKEGDFENHSFAIKQRSSREYEDNDNRNCGKYSDKDYGYSDHNGGGHASWKEATNGDDLVRYPLVYPSKVHGNETFGVDIVNKKATYTQASLSSTQSHRLNGCSKLDFAGNNPATSSTRQSFHSGMQQLQPSNLVDVNTIDRITSHLTNSIPSLVTLQNNQALPTRVNILPAIPPPIELPNLNQPPPGFLSPTENHHFPQQPLLSSYAQTSFLTQIPLRPSTNDAQVPPRHPINPMLSSQPPPGFSTRPTNHLKPSFSSHPPLLNQLPLQNYLLPPHSFQFPPRKPSIHFAPQPPTPHMNNPINMFPSQPPSTSIYNQRQPPLIHPNNFNTSNNDTNHHSLSNNTPEHSTSPPPPAAPLFRPEHSSEDNNADKDLLPPPPPPPRKSLHHNTTTSAANINNHPSNKLSSTNNNAFTTACKEGGSDRYSPYSSTSEGSVDDSFANNIFDDSLGSNGVNSPAIESNHSSNKSPLEATSSNQTAMKDELANEIIKNVNNSINLTHLTTNLSDKLQSKTSNSTTSFAHPFTTTTTAKNIKSDQLISLAKSLDLSGSLGIHVSDLKKVLETANSVGKQAPSNHHKAKVDTTPKPAKGRKIERVVEEVKVALRPHFCKNLINKEDYKSIMRRAVPKIMCSKSNLDSSRVKTFIQEYVTKVLVSKKLHKLKHNAGVKSPQKTS